MTDWNTGEWYPWMEPARGGVNPLLGHTRIIKILRKKFGYKAEFKIVDGMIWARDLPARKRKN